MPEKHITLTVFPNGYVAIYDARDSFIGETKAIPVPSHGDLIDRDMVLKKSWDMDTFYDAVRFAPTIIPAEKEEDDG